MSTHLYIPNELTIGVTFVFFSHKKVLEGITICGEMRQQERFTPIVQGLCMEDPNMKVSGRS